ncbi:MAG: DUF3024 domain-containing protein [candidate division Zixibacteria bacterium]
MAFSEPEKKEYEIAAGAFLEKRRPPENIRDQLDIGFRIKGQSIEIIEIRPVWNNPEEKMESPVAKTTYVRKQNVWKVYWQRADLKWHGYSPKPEVSSIEEFLDLVDEDAMCCFWG